MATSRPYITSAIGPRGQCDYVNCVVAVRSALGPHALLSRMKVIERRAGRTRRGPRWSARTLDIDVIDYRGRITGTSSHRTAGSLILPHPEIHHRPFVIMPLAEIAPHWRHPRTGQQIAWLRWRLARQNAGRIIAPPESTAARIGAAPVPRQCDGRL